MTSIQVLQYSCCYRETKEKEITTEQSFFFGGRGGHQHDACFLLKDMCDWNDLGIANDAVHANSE